MPPLALRWSGSGDRRRADTRVYDRSMTTEANKLGDQGIAMEEEGLTDQAHTNLAA